MIPTYSIPALSETNTSSEEGCFASINTYSPALDSYLDDAVTPQSPVPDLRGAQCASKYEQKISATLGPIETSLASNWETWSNDANNPEGWDLMQDIGSSSSCDGMPQDLVSISLTQTTLCDEDGGGPAQLTAVNIERFNQMTQRSTVNELIWYKQQKPSTAKRTHCSTVRSFTMLSHLELPSPMLGQAFSPANDPYINPEIRGVGQWSESEAAAWRSARLRLLDHDGRLSPII